MRPHIDLDISQQPDEIKNVIEGAIDIIDKLSQDKTDIQKTKIYKDNEGYIHIDVVPSTNNAVGITMYIYELDNISVGVSHGFHEHFDNATGKDNIAMAALNLFRDLLYAEQSTTVTLKKGKPISWETIFNLDGKEIKKALSKQFPSNPFIEKSYERYTYSYL